MDDHDETRGRSAAPTEPTPPKEPFAYIKTSPGMAFRSPAALTLFYAGFICFGIWAIWAGIGAYVRVGAVGGLVMSVGGLAAVAGGSFAVYMGIRRWQWKREYERVMGRSPW